MVAVVLWLTVCPPCVTVPVIVNEVDPGGVPVTDPPDFEELPPPLHPEPNPIRAKMATAAISRKEIRLRKGKRVSRNRAANPIPAVLTAECCAVVCTVTVAVAGCPLTGTVTGSQDANAGSCEHVTVTEPVKPPTGVTTIL